EYDEICNYLMKETGSRLFAGFWKKKKRKDPGVEPSFWYYDLNFMMKIAVLFNQESILDWKLLCIGDEKNKYIRNPFYDKNSPKLDKEAILRKIREDK
ncbi:MAG TPA: hypothetical protein DCY93_02035, partial [Firmicutes bacterium]|nr:hypothetical protein [Bacillota bacterium]